MWSLYQPVVHGLLNSEVRSRCVANTGDSTVESRREMVSCLVELVGERSLQVSHKVDATTGNVHVAIEKAWQYGEASSVHLNISIETVTDVTDAVVLKYDVGRCCGATCAVEDFSTP